MPMPHPKKKMLAISVVTTRIIDRIEKILTYRLLVVIRSIKKANKIEEYIP